jgi:hypothetical protein
MFARRVSLFQHEQRTAHAAFPRKVTEQRIDISLHEAFASRPVNPVTATLGTLDFQLFFNLSGRTSGRHPMLPGSETESSVFSDGSSNALLQPPSTKTHEIGSKKAASNISEIE